MKHNEVIYNVMIIILYNKIIIILGGLFSCENEIIFYLQLLRNL